MNTTESRNVSVANIKGVRITIKISSIIYLEVMKRVIYVHTASGKTYQFYSTLNNMLSRLEGFGFENPSKLCCKHVVH